MKTWRDIAKPIIASVIAKVGTDDMKALRSALRDAFPRGVRQYHPYKIWLSEVRVQLGLAKLTKSLERRRPILPCNGQQNLFGKESEDE